MENARENVKKPLGFFGRKVARLGAWQNAFFSETSSPKLFRGVRKHKTGKEVDPHHSHTSNKLGLNIKYLPKWVPRGFACPTLGKKKPLSPPKAPRARPNRRTHDPSTRSPMNRVFGFPGTSLNQNFPHPNPGFSGPTPAIGDGEPTEIPPYGNAAFFHLLLEKKRPGLRESWGPSREKTGAEKKGPSFQTVGARPGIPRDHSCGVVFTSENTKETKDK